MRPPHMTTPCRAATVKAVMALVIAVALTTASTASAAAPPNDARVSPQVIALGATATGTTAEATTEPFEPASGCGPVGPSVWYELDPATNGRAIAVVQALGDLDVVVDVFLRVRSQVQPLSCDTNDRRGEASVDFSVRGGDSYLIRVAQQPQSAPGTFTLTTGIAAPPERPPGRALGRAGVTGSVQRIFAPADAWSTRLRQGVTYRVNLARPNCMRLSIFGPGTSSFDDEPVRRLPCGGYTIITPGPGEGGRYSFLVESASRVRSAQRYHLQVGRAGADDTAPGRFIRNHVRVRGGLSGGRLDVVDLYRFDVLQASITQLSLDAGGRDFVLALRTERGHVVASGDDFSVRTKPGRYFAVVRARAGATGRYRLSRASRTITRTRLTATPSTARSRSAVTLTALVRPGVGGPVTIVVERLDPLAGFQFIRSFAVRASGGRAQARFLPPSVGLYRARATFAGTRDAARSETGFVRFAVEDPLRD